MKQCLKSRLLLQKNTVCKAHQNCKKIPLTKNQLKSQKYCTTTLLIFFVHTEPLCHLCLSCLPYMIPNWTILLGKQTTCLSYWDLLKSPWKWKICYFGERKNWTKIDSKTWKTNQKTNGAWECQTTTTKIFNLQARIQLYTFTK